VVVRLKRVIAAGEGSPLGDLGSAELAQALAQALGPMGSVTLASRESLKPRVFRLRLVIDGRDCSLIAKRMPPEYARRNELAIRRWLPEVDLAGLAPGLRGIGAASDGSWVWHVYDDLGPWELDPVTPDPDRVAAVVRAIASLHTRFAAHPTLAECRLHGENRDASHMATMVRDAIRALERLRLQRFSPIAAAAEVRDRLLPRLRRLHAEAPARARALAEWGGPETLLHGDLWTTNTFAEPTESGIRVRFVDWDRAGVGSASYDLSTLLLRFAPGQRDGIVALYRQAAGEAGWRLPGRRELNLLFETAEYARYANRVIWPALALLREGAPWGLDELRAIEGWFEALTPVLPTAMAPPREPGGAPAPVTVQAEPRS
jgi:hypothetical protein